MGQFQSAYKPSHSTESALLKVQDDILQVIDNDQCLILLLLDLSAAFDTVDHRISLASLTDRFGIDGKARDWFKSYLSGLMQFVAIGSARSFGLPLNCGVPQGSVLGPILYLLYVDPLGDIMRHHNVSFHFYAEVVYFGWSFQGTLYVGSLCCVMYVINLNLMAIRRRCWFSMLSTALLPSLIKFKQPEHLSPLPLLQRILRLFSTQRFRLTNTLRKFANPHFILLGTFRASESFKSPDSVDRCPRICYLKLDNCNSLLYGLSKNLLQRLQYICFESCS